MSDSKTFVSSSAIQRMYSSTFRALLPRGLPHAPQLLDTGEQYPISLPTSLFESFACSSEFESLVVPFIKDFGRLFCLFVNMLATVSAPYS